MRTSRLAILALLIIATGIVPSLRRSEAQSAGPDIPKFAAALISLVPGGGTVLAGVNTAYEIEEWAAGTQTVEAKFLDDSRTHHVNLSHTYWLPFVVNYAYSEYPLGRPVP